MNLKFLGAAIVATLLFACNKKQNERVKTTEKRSVQFALNQQLNSRNFSEKPSAVIISVMQNGSMVYNKQKVSLYNFNGLYLSEPVEMTPGAYELSDFFVVTASDEVLLAAPKKGSALAGMVEQPLHLNFNVTLDYDQKVAPEVVGVFNNSPADFGYATFTWKEVKVTGFWLSAHIFDAAVQNLVITNAHLLIKDSLGKIVTEQDFAALTTKVFVPTKTDMLYTLTVSKLGYKTHTQTISHEELANLGNKVIKVILEEGAVRDIQHVTCWFRDDNINNSNDLYREKMFISYWTFSGDRSDTRSFVQFESVKQIQQGVEIKNATLTFHHTPSVPYEDNRKSPILIKNIIEPWNETTGFRWSTQPKTTDSNLVYAVTDMGDFVNIDVTALVQDMVNLPADQRHGFLLMVATESPYHSARFYTNDHSDVSKHPKLEIVY